MLKLSVGEFPEAVTVDSYGYTAKAEPIMGSKIFAVWRILAGDKSLVPELNYQNLTLRLGSGERDQQFNNFTAEAVYVTGTRVLPCDDTKNHSVIVEYITYTHTDVLYDWGEKHFRWK